MVDRKKKQKGRTSVSPRRSTRSSIKKPISRGDQIDVVYPLGRLQLDLGSSSDEWVAVRSSNGFHGISVHPDTLKKLCVFSGSLVVLYPSVYLDSGNGMDGVPVVVTRIYVSNECSVKGRLLLLLFFLRNLTDVYSRGGIEEMV